MREDDLFALVRLRNALPALLADNRRMAEEAERLRKAVAPPAPITMQDVRLRTGEGKLSATDVLAACNAELAARARAP